ncbi:MAG TPA: SpoIIE family protein phosphatase [bacterium]|nr:SpoIIE family protein phosphatase [bacterium]HNT64140.1 SpoIIE family protein phosphatase [bacterium]HOX87461.1 SpoIIE family protein phosphatase [bacterium]HPG47177.1 SpoIIE family protein phosphatase [bacterium]HPM99484.1 SpoIIE family protein phosphatase [bacterium]
MPARILVVDDEPDLEQLILQKFRKQIRDGIFAFQFAGNGVQALERLAEDDAIDLVLTDINMPEMDGLTLLNRIKEQDNPLLRSVIVSAYGDIENIRTAMNRGAFDFIIKPIDLNDLEITINKSLHDLRVLKEAIQSRDQLMFIKHELGIATEIQTSILPKVFPPFPDRKEFDIYAKMIPAREVGGDLYDFFQIDKARVGVIIGDVSGKGIPAAMFMAVSKTLLKATALKGIPPDSCLESVNTILVDESLPSMFVTVFYGIFDTRNGSFEYCSGGHNPPYIIGKDGQVRLLDNCGGLFLGSLKNLEYESSVVMLQPGETLFLVTDGITEAMNTGDDMFGEERTEAALQTHAGKPLNELVDHVIEEVQAFAGAQEQSDDMTCLALRYFGR